MADHRCGDNHHLLNDDFSVYYYFNYIKMSKSKLKVGDIVTRLLGGVLPMQVRVTEINEKEIVCGAWKFHPATGGEIDEDLDWDGVFRTGSQIEDYEKYIDEK